MGGVFGDRMETRGGRILRAERDLYASLYDLAPVGYFTFDDRGRVLDVNETGATLLGAARDHLVGTSFATWIAEHERGAFVQSVRDCLASRGRTTAKLSLVDALGNRIPVLLVSVPDPALPLRAVRTVVVDVNDGGTGRSPVESFAGVEALFASLDPTESIAISARLPLPAFGDWCVVCVADPVSAPSHRVAATHLDPARTDAIAAIERGGSELPRALAATIEEGLPRIVEAAGSGDAPLAALGPGAIAAVPLVARRRTIGALAVGATDQARRYDQDELRGLEAFARVAALAIDNAMLHRDVHEAVRERDTFLSIASHEIKTPLTSVQLQVQVLIELARRGELAAVPAEQATDQLAGIDRQVRRLGRLICQLLDLSRIRTGRFELVLATVEVGELVREAVDAFRPVSPRHALALEEPHEPIRVVGDRDRLEEVVLNLLDNAAKYSPNGGTITVRLERRGPEAIVEVRDEGLGIPAEQRARLFDRFWRGEAVRGTGGLGLGLFICRQIVAAHGGHIAVASEPGRGSIFTVSIPIERTDGREESRRGGP